MFGIGWESLITPIANIVDKLIPDPNAAAEAKTRLVELGQKGELAELDAVVKLAQGQMDVNKAEAMSGDKFAARWRPSIGYVGCAALAFYYILNPLLLWILVLTGHGDVQAPKIALDDHLWELIGCMLGMGGWRTLDKLKGKAS